jgi:hypothetical protein
MASDPSEVVVPFGKHKGATVGELLTKDPQYAQWLSAQGWLAQRFAEVHAAIAARGAGSEETPEHNALQVRFLDPDFCKAALKVLHPNRLAKAEAEATESVILRAVGWNADEVQIAKGKAELEAEGELPLRLHTNVMFEDRFADVAIRWEYRLARTSKCYTEKYETRIELKPTMGDDFPAVMRQMQRNQCPGLIVGEYTGVGVSERQLRQMFEANRRCIAFVRDVESELRKSVTPD